MAEQAGGFGSRTITVGNDFDVVLKDYYEGPVREHLNNSIPILKYVEKSKRKWNGRAVVFPVHTGRNFGVGARGETDQIPTAGKQSYIESRILSKFLYGRIRITGPVIAASQGNKGSFASALRTEVEGMRSDLRVDMNRQILGNLGADADAAGSPGGENGILAVISEAQDAGALTTIKVDNPGTRYIKKGMTVTIGLLGGGDGNTLAATNTGVTVSSVDSTTQFTISTNSAAYVNNEVVVLGDANASSFQNEVTGLSFLATDSTEFSLQAIDPSSNPEWTANVLSNDGNGNRPLSLELMQLCIDTADEVAGEEPNLIMGHHSMRREYINLLTSDVRYAPEQLKGGFQKLTYAGGMKPMPIEFDRMAPYNKLFFLQTKDIRLYTMKDWQWADRDGSTFSRIADRDSWEAFMCWYGNLGLERRFAQTVLTEITVDNLIF